MEFKDGVGVYTFEGKEAGNLRRVVVDPETREVTHIVILKGLLVKEDKVIPVQNILSATEEKLVLDCTLAELKEMPPLEIEEYEPVDGLPGQGPGFDPLADNAYSPHAPQRYVLKQAKRTIPEELVALKEGAQVMSEEGEHVGNVEQVFTEPDTGKITHLIVSKGLLLKSRKAIPIQWVKILSDEKVRLAVGTQQLEALPEARQ